MRCTADVEKDYDVMFPIDGVHQNFHYLVRTEPLVFLSSLWGHYTGRLCEKNADEEKSI
jgi:hypothetical protein